MIRVLVVRAEADVDVERISSEITRALEKQGALARPVRVERVEAVVKTALGKARS